MATVTPRPFDRADVNRRVRHPLEALRGTIRRYVILEGLAVAVLYLAIWFWVGLALDYGPFALFGFDWIKELDHAGGETASFWLRAFLLIALVAGLVTVVAFKVVRRLMREFSDRALALVLERRFPRELGDRLITAVEMADPKLAEKYGYSQVMLDQTIRDAADRVEKLPVHEVFNWARLRGYLLWAGLASVGMYLVVGIASCVIAGVLGRSASPVNFFFEFNHISATWCQRNILLQEHRYWLGNEYLEFVRFPGDAQGKMRVARDEYRPDVYVRAVKWVIADRGPDAPEGWRALRWSDLPNVLGEVPQVNLPADWPGWVIDLDDLDPRVPAGILPADWGWQNKTSGHIRKELQTPRVRAVLDSERAKKVGAREAIERLLDWHTWTFDRIELQALERAAVRQALRDRPETEAAYRAFEKVAEELKALAESPRMRGTLRQLRVPKMITVHRRGKKSKSSDPLNRQENNKYSFNLNELKESVTFYFTGDEYTTGAKEVTLVPPPAVNRLLVDKQEPAYLYYRLLGDDAGKLKGARQHFRGVPVSTDGDKTVIPVPRGTTLTVKAAVNRDLKEGTARISEPARRDVAGSLTPAVTVTVLGPRAFAARFEDVRRDLEFDFEFRDTDNVRGRRHVVIKPLDDEAPKLVGVAVAVNLRPDSEVEGVKGAARSGERLLITPNALVPFRGRVEDKNGLSAVDFRYEVVPLPFQRLGDAHAGKQEPAPPLQGNPTSRRAGLVLSLFQFTPGDPTFGLFAPAYVAGIAGLKKADLPGESPESGLIEMPYAQVLFNTPRADDVTYDEMVRLLQIQPRNRPLAAELIDLKGAKEQADFVRTLKEGNQHEALLRDVLHFLKLDIVERERLWAQIDAQPEKVVNELLEILKKKDPEEKKQLLALLKKQPEKMIVREHMLDRASGEPGFDVRKHLPKIKASARETQRHYEVRLFVIATDNNVETGPRKAPPKGPFTFLVISENELIAEIIKQERKLYTLLKETTDALEGRKTTLDAEMLKLGSPQPELSFVAARADLARKAVRETGDIARSVLEKYHLIVTELEVNRVEGGKLEKLNKRIVEPLERLTNKSDGYVRAVEKNVTRFWNELENDLARLKKAAAEKKANDSLLKELDDRRVLHQEEGKEASRQMGVLIGQLRDVLEAMQDTIEADKLIEMLVRLEADQREAERVLRAHREELERILLQDLLGPDPKGSKSQKR